MSTNLSEEGGIRLAIEGCGHGTLHAIYASVQESCRQKSWPGVDLLVIGGDFQAVRNCYDLECVSMPAKYRAMHDFHEYYSGHRTAPYLTIFVGGNHEASNYLFELHYGGWVAPNIYYMGAANVLRLGPLRICGMSGIWKGYNYRKPHLERLPYNQNDIKSIYHVRELNVRKLLQLRTQVDIGISHDWPKGVEWHGNHRQLFTWKKHLEEDARANQLGSVAAQEVMNWLRPRYWFSAHLHVKYAAIIHHEKREEPVGAESVTAKNDNEIDLEMDDGTPAQPNGADKQENPGEEKTIIVKNVDELDLESDDDAATTHLKGSSIREAANADEIDLDLDDVPEQPVPNKAVEEPKQAATSSNMPYNIDEAIAALPAAFHQQPRKPPVLPKEITNNETYFLALDKCEPKRHFLQLMPVPSVSFKDSDRPVKLQYDREWLAVTRAFAVHEPNKFGDPEARIPPRKTQDEYISLIDEQQSWVDQNITESELEVPLNFAVVAPVYDGGTLGHSEYRQVREYPNPQTAQFCALLKIPNALAISEEDCISRQMDGPRQDGGDEHFSASRGNRGGYGRGRGRGRGGRGDRGHNKFGRKH